MKQLPGLLLAALACARTTPLQSAAANTELEIRAARQAQNAAIAARNADSVATFWAEDVAVTAGLGFVLRGRDAYKVAFGHDASMLYSRVPDHIVVSDRWPLAWEEGNWTGTATDQSTPALSGRYSAQWVKQSGRWLIRSELFVALNCAGPACAWPIRLR